MWSFNPSCDPANATSSCRRFCRAYPVCKMSALNVSDTHEGSTTTSAAFPTSIGGLLAEEWTINPLSVLPSSLEVIMMDEVRRSGREALRSSIDLVQQNLTRWTEAHPRSLSRRQLEVSESEGDINGNESRPQSWFELFAELYHRRVLAIGKFLSQSVLRPYGPEIVLFITYAAERWSLMNVSATASEALYGGKRVKLKGSSSSTSNGSRAQSQGGKSAVVQLGSMDKRDAIKLATLSAMGPYLAERLDQWYRRQQQQSQRQTRQNSSSFRWRQLIASPNFPKSWKQLSLFVYPFLSMSSQAMRVYYQWKYLLGRSLYFDPISHLLNLPVRRVTIEDQEGPPQLPTASAIPSPHSPSRTSSTARSETILTHVAFVILSSAVAIGFLARLYAERRIRRRQQLTSEPGTREGEHNAVMEKQANRIMFPPPPARHSISTTSTRASFNTCPLCHQPRVLPTASTSGYVFCLKCLLRYLRERGETCPITGQKCPESSIIRLYEPRHHGRP